jgi:predicted amidophosphoribosyltransferase
MEQSSFDKNFLKNIRPVLCPKCNNEFEVNANEVEAVCEECGECIQTNFGDYSREEFVWHPKRYF